VGERLRTLEEFIVNRLAPRGAGRDQGSGRAVGTAGRGRSQGTAARGRVQGTAGRGRGQDNDSDHDHDRARRDCGGGLGRDEATIGRGRGANPVGGGGRYGPPRGRGRGRDVAAGRGRRDTSPNREEESLSGDEERTGEFEIASESLGREPCDTVGPHRPSLLTKVKLAGHRVRMTSRSSWNALFDFCAPD